MMNQSDLPVNQPLAIGIVGGMSPESTVTYYQQIVHKHQSEFQDHNYPRIVIASVSFQKYIAWQHIGAWDQIGIALEKEFCAVAAAGADFAVLATNTMHKILPNIKSPIPVLSILDAVGSYANEKGIKSIALTGTKFTMSDGFYARGLENNGLTVIIPTATQQEVIHRIIYEELIIGRVESSSVDAFAEIVQRLSDRGAGTVLLGCTELELLTREREFQVRIIDSTRVHAEAAWRVSIAMDLSNPMLSKG
jgi:aspartate racemase